MKSFHATAGNPGLNFRNFGVMLFVSPIASSFGRMILSDPSRSMKSVLPGSMAASVDLPAPPVP